MNAEGGVAAGVDPESKWIFRAGAISGWALVIGYLATFPLYASVGDPPPAGVEAQLEYFGSHAAGWWLIAWLMVVTDLLLLPLFLALYRALRNVGRDLMLLAVACIGLFVAVDLSVTWTAYSVLIAAGSDYAAATSGATKAALAARAAYPSAVLESPVAGLCAIALPALGALLMGLVMLRGIFTKATAYVALVAGVTGIAFMISYVIEAFAVLRYINALLMTATYILASLRLYRLGRG